MASTCSLNVLPILIALTCLQPIQEASGASKGPAGETPPNILVILLDDVGPEQIQCFDTDSPGAGLDPGCNLYDSPYPYAPTPNITLLAKNGVRFTRAFTSPVCSPSRAQLMTGRYPHHNQIGNIIKSNGEAKDLNPRSDSDLSSRVPQLPGTEIQFPKMIPFSTADPAYRMGMFGKWHLTGNRCVVDEYVTTALGDPGVPDPPANWLLDSDGGEHPKTTASGWPLFHGIRSNYAARPSAVSDGCTAATRNNYFDWLFVREPEAMESPEYKRCDAAVTNMFCDPIRPNPCPAGETDPLPVNQFTVREYTNTFITTTIREEVQEFALSNEGEPWFAVWSPQACHGPFSWPPPRLHDYGPDPVAFDNGNHTWLRFRALLQSFDTELGILRSALDQGDGETMWDRTVVILLGDNGTDENAVMTSEATAVAFGVPGGGVAGVMSPYVLPGPYLPIPNPTPKQVTRFKGSPYVSGTSMICVVSGPIVVNPGRAYGGLVDMVDIFPTVQDLAQVPAGSWEPPGYSIDGVSLLPVLLDIGPTGRTQSLAMSYSPNGPFEISDPGGIPGGGDTRLYRIGYTQEITGQGTLDGMYHLVLQRWVQANGGLWDLVVREPIELYKLCDAAGDNVDTQQVSDLSATHPGILSSMCAAVGALINPTNPIDFCSGPVSPP